MDLLSLSHMPTIKAVMTPFPYYVEIDAPVSEAEAIIREHGVRHVPVQKDGEPVGIISDRDISLLVNRALGTSERQRIRVRHICVTEDLYVADVDAPLDQVLDDMAERQIGSVLVAKKGKLAGIFTTTDACRALAVVMRDRHGRLPDEVA